MRDFPDLVVASWLDLQPRSSVWTTSVTVLEIESGLQIMPVGKRRSSLSEGFENLLDRIDHRIAVFDEEAARLAANLTAVRQRKGRVGEIRDTMIAGIVLANRASLATLNVTHFADISETVISPWTA